MKGSAFFGGAGGYCPHVRLITRLRTTGLDRLVFLKHGPKNNQKQTVLKSVGLGLPAADHLGRSNQIIWHRQTPIWCQNTGG